MHRKERIQVVGFKTNSNTSEPTAPYVKTREIIRWTCWAIGESNPGPIARAASDLTTRPPRPVNRINFKLCLMIHAAAADQCPQYIRNIVHHLDGIGFEQQRVASSTSQDIVFSERAFSVAGYASGTLFHKTLQTSQTEKLLNERLTHYFKLASVCWIIWSTICYQFLLCTLPLDN